jgi:ribonuclease Z
MALIHYSPRYTDSDLKKLLDEARCIFPDTILSRDRMILPIEYTD